MSDQSQRQREYWKKNIGLIRNLLIVWFLVSYVPAIFFAEPLYNVPFFKLPLSFWFAQQGSILVFIVLIYIYAKQMDKLDEEYDVQEVQLTDKRGG
ncbi:MAG: DUF4212 domain-containing protein [Bacillaceae bacterium]|nr:DUF4212 domain-containing protein [Bacillaceae bacterium]